MSHSDPMGCPGWDLMPCHAQRFRPVYRLHAGEAEPSLDAMECAMCHRRLRFIDGDWKPVED